MLVYLASSYKNEAWVRMINKILLADGIDTYCFASKELESYKISKSIKGDQHVKEWDQQAARADTRTRMIFDAHLASLKECTHCLLILPCGNSSHLEAGYIAGRGGEVVIFGELKIGEWDSMYHFASEIWHEEQITQMRTWFQKRLLSGMWEKIKATRHGS